MLEWLSLAALKVASSSLASYLQVTNFAITKDTLPRTNLGKIKRHELRARYDQALAEEKAGTKGSCERLEAKMLAKQEVLSHLILMTKFWWKSPPPLLALKWLKERFPEQEIRLDTSPQLDLNIDSLEWMHLTLELVEHTGVELTGEAVSRVTTVRELLSEIVASAEGRRGCRLTD
jgi:long-chain acyl-CoA synthetase